MKKILGRAFILTAALWLATTSYAEPNKLDQELSMRSTFYNQPASRQTIVWEDSTS